MSLSPRHDLFYIEPQGDYKTICDIYLKNDQSRFLIPNAKHSAVLVEEAAKRGIDISGRVVHFHTVDSIHDDMLYETAMELATKFMWGVRFHAAQKSNNKFLLHDAAADLSLRITLHDRFVAILRAANKLHSYLREHPQASLNLIPRNPSLIFALRQVAEALGHNATTRTEHIPRDSGRDGVLPSKQDRWRLPTTFKPSSTFDWNRLHTNLNPGGLLYFTNMRALQFSHGSLPVLASLRWYFPDICVLTNHPGSSQNEQDARSAGIKSENIFFRSETPIEPKQIDASARSILFSAFRRFESYCLGHENPVVRAVSYILIDHLRQTVCPLFHYAHDFSHNMRVVLPHASCVVVLPGRYLEPNLMVGIARALKRPTIEIQSGPMSATKRFLKPRADYVLCNDLVSRSLFTDYLKHNPERVTVVGSPKIDADLRDLRQQTMADARSALPELAGVTETEIFLLATQPIGVDTSGAVCRMTIEGVLGKPDAFILLKQHPNEGPEYARRYSEIAEELGFSRLIISNTANIHTCIIASNLVLTYFSTVGMEAFSLGRPVVCVNPFEWRPPFDLVSLGIAVEARDASGVAALVLGDLKQNNIPEMSVLQDGLAAKRCAEFIWRRVAYSRRMLGLGT